MDKTVVGSFDDYQAAQRAAHSLMQNGFRETEISVIASTDHFRTRITLKYSRRRAVSSSWGWVK